MKKLLLTLLCGIGLVSMAQAETYTFKMADHFGTSTVNPISEWTEGGFTFTPSQAAGGNAPAYNWAGDVRMYAKNTLTITAAGAKITNISFEISKQGIDRFPEVTPSVGQIAAQGVSPLVWNGSSEAVTFTVGDKAVYGSDTSKGGQFDFDALTITTDGPVGNNPGTPDTPDTPAEDAIYGLDAIMNMENNATFTMGVDLTVVYANGSNVYVYDGKNYGLIYKNIGAKAGDVIAKGWAGKVSIYSTLYEMVPNDAVKFNGTASIPEPLELDAEMAAVSLIPANQNMYVKLLGVTFAADTPSARSNFTGTMGEGDDVVSMTFRNNFQIAGVSAGKYDVVAFISVYNSNVQIYPVEYIGESQEIELPVLESFNMLPDLENGAEFKVGVDVTVIYSSGAYTYVSDGVQNALIYKYDLGLKAGDVIAQGWNASLTIYNELLEIIPSSELTVKSSDGVIPAPIEVPADEISLFVAAYNQAAYITLTQVTLADGMPAKGAFTGKVGDEEVAFYQRFNLDTVEAGVYDITGFIAVYGSTVQIYPCSVVASSSSLTTNWEESNMPVKYYNIQGMPIANPQPGNIYIQVKGNKAVKVIK